MSALDDAQRKKAAFLLDDDEERHNWGYFPRDFHGLSLGEMDVAQQKAVHRLVASGLSRHAYAKATAIMALENVLDALEGRLFHRDPAHYFVSVFGVPDSERWGWRFEGHHVSLNFNIDGTLISPTPIFLGANPAAVRHGELAVVRPCGEEEDAARELLASLDEEQRRSAILTATVPPDIVLMNLPRVPERQFPEAMQLSALQLQYDKMSTADREALLYERGRPRGLAASHMDPSQRKLLDALIRVYVERLPEDAAVIALRIAIGANPEALHFAWAGDNRPRYPHYYRVQGARLLIEYDNTQNDANHVHSVWRDPERDFGPDVLRRHITQQHLPA